MAINWQLNLKNKVNEQAEWKQTHRYKEHFDGCLMGRWLGGDGEKGEGIKKYTLVVTEWSWGVKYSIGNI